MITPSVASRQLPLEGGAVFKGYGWRWRQMPARVSAPRLSDDSSPSLAGRGQGRVLLLVPGVDVQEAGVGVGAAYFGLKARAHTAVRPYQILDVFPIP